MNTEAIKAGLGAEIDRIAARRVRCTSADWELLATCSRNVKDLVGMAGEGELKESLKRCQRLAESKEFISTNFQLNGLAEQLHSVRERLG